MKKRIKIFIVSVLCVCMLFPAVMASAVDFDSYQQYDWGEEYNGAGGRCYVLKLKEKSNVYLYLKVHGTLASSTNVLDASGKKVLTLNDFSVVNDETTGHKTYSLTRILPKGQYLLEISMYKDEYTLFGTAEPAITLTRPTITSLKNSASKKMTVKVSAVKNRTGYEFQYATNTAFSDAKTVNGGRSRTISGLTKGKTYYVRARAYTIYGAGNKVCSAWSTVQYVKIKK